MVNEGNGTNDTEATFVDITELSRNRDFKVEAKEDDTNATENSSSFADTASENQSSSKLSDTEVESQFLGEDDFHPAIDGLGSMFPIRKKRLSAHWRNFIKPLMWRCKWTELRIRELESQASKYAREIDAHNRMKHMALDHIRVQLSGSKSLMYTDQSCKKRPMKRMKRKRVEDTADIASHMSNHILFSLHENKRSGYDTAPRWEDLGSADPHASGNDEFVFHDDPEFMLENNNILEQMLRKIETVHTNVHKMKAQLDSLMIKNFDKFSSSENLSQLVPFQTSSVPTSPTLSACNEETASLGRIYSSPHHISDYDFGDFMMHDSAVSSFGEAIDIPDIIESTVGLLSSVDVTGDHAQVGDSSEKIVDNILIQNEAVELERPILKTCLKQHNGTDIVVDNEGDNTAPEHEISGRCVERLNLNSSLASEIHFPKNKRKRGERKAGSSNWSRQRPNGPDT